MIAARELTDEQRAIAGHEKGAALVFAVAGAGKTTSMVHRINYLVHGRGVDPGRILASSFSRATVSDVGEALSAVGVEGVEARTLHSLGFRLIRQAEREGYLPPRTSDQEENPSTLATILAGRALTKLAMERSIDTDELGIDRDELVDQVAAWKQELAYAALDDADLPASAREYASQAEHDNEDFLTLYRLFERLRREQGWLTFADMLREGWEVLHRFPDLRERAQAAYDHVLVDEFQDVSRVQYWMLDVLTEPASPDAPRNYMAIGDDDQCIYEWRGADPSFILGFTDRYDADEYLITDNFRSPAPQIALANAVIACNDERREKQMHLTRGFDGFTDLTGRDGPRAEADAVVDEIEALREDGRSLDEMAVLVRTYAQTPFFESRLIDRDLPYRIVGNVPFYRRREVRTLLQYGYWAVLERRLDRSGWFDSRRDAARYVDRFQRILKRPNRYVKHDLIEQVGTEATQKQISVLDALVSHRPSMHDRTAERVDRFLSVAERLVDRLDDPADEVLEWLMEAIDYASYLRERSAIAEIGEARVRTARSLTAFAEGFDDVPSLLDEIVRISFEHAEHDPEADWLDVRSIHRAKGLEWPFVFVPGLNEGTLPQHQTRVGTASPPEDLSFDAFADRSAAGEEVEVDREEERRLLYVAITRSKEGLYLSYDTGEDVSSFLDDAGAEEVLEQAGDVERGLTTPPDELSDDDLARLCAGVAELDVERYLRHRYDPPDARRRALLDRLRALADQAESAREKVESHAEAVAARESEVVEVQKRRSQSFDAVRELVRATGERGLPLQNEQPDTYYPDDARFTFEWNGEEVVAYCNGERAGTFDPLSAGGPSPSVALDAPWESIIATFAGVGRGRKTVYVSIDRRATFHRVADAADAGTTDADTTDADTTDSPSAADSPDLDAQTRRLASSPVQSGLTLLQQALRDTATS